MGFLTMDPMGARMTAVPGRSILTASTMNIRDTPRADVFWLAALTAIGAAVRVVCLQQPISYDEAFTFLNYIAPGGTHFFDYSNPNNHIFHSILSRACTVMFGHQLWTMR